MSIVRCCKDCENRQVGCHSTCEKYINEKKRHDELKHKEFIDRETLRAIRYVRFKV